MDAINGGEKKQGLACDKNNGDRQIVMQSMAGIKAEGYMGDLQ